eukprot:7846115-Pyramimonas_sp.AAC.1
MSCEPFLIRRCDIERKGGERGGSGSGPLLSGTVWNSGPMGTPMGSPPNSQDLLHMCVEGVRGPARIGKTVNKITMTGLSQEALQHCQRIWGPSCLKLVWSMRTYRRCWKPLKSRDVSLP